MALTINARPIVKGKNKRIVGWTISDGKFEGKARSATAMLEDVVATVHKRIKEGFAPVSVKVYGKTGKVSQHVTYDATGNATKHSVRTKKSTASTTPAKKTKTKKSVGKGLKAYQKFIKAEMAAGKTFKQAKAAWKAHKAATAPTTGKKTATTAATPKPKSKKTATEGRTPKQKKYASFSKRATKVGLTKAQRKAAWKKVQGGMSIADALAAKTAAAPKPKTPKQDKKPKKPQTSARTSTGLPAPSAMTPAKSKKAKKKTSTAAAPAKSKSKSDKPKRKPSAYNKHVKAYFASHPISSKLTGTAKKEALQARMAAAAAAWNKSKK
jgi:hypothetical protein